VGADSRRCIHHPLSQKAEAAGKNNTIFDVYNAGREKVKAIRFFPEADDESAFFAPAAFNLGAGIGGCSPVREVKV